MVTNNYREYIQEKLNQIKEALSILESTIVTIDKCVDHIEESITPMDSKSWADVGGNNRLQWDETLTGNKCCYSQEILCSYFDIHEALDGQYILIWTSRHRDISSYYYNETLVGAKNKAEELLDNWLRDLY